jgi:hypothetical protein
MLDISKVNQKLSEDDRLLFHFWYRQVAGIGHHAGGTIRGKIRAFGNWKRSLGEEKVESILLRLKFELVEMAQN